MKKYFTAEKSGFLLGALIATMFLFSVPVSASEKSLTLMETYQLALKKSETVAVSAEEINQAQARFYRAFDYFLPTVNFQMSRFNQDAGDSNSSFGNSGRRSTPENKFTFSQPIFSGFKEFAALKGSGADKKEQQKLLQRARELLFVDVMDAYYNVLQTRKDIAVLDEQHKLLEDRLKELTERIRVGRSREMEQQTSLSDLKVLEADLVQARSDAVHAVNLLEFYIGESLEDRDLADEGTIEELSELSSYVSKASLRSDVQAAEQNTIVADSKVVAAQADLLPTATADGNFYTRRVGFQNGNDWDATLTLTVPVFEVGQTLGDIKQAAASREQSSLKFRQARRTAELDIRDSFENLQSSHLEEKALQEANEASKKDYELQTKDYRQNLVNNLDVLDSLRRYQGVNRRYNQAYYLSKRNFWKFKIALGELPAAEFKK